MNADDYYVEPIRDRTLTRAGQLINGDRQNDYGTPEQSFGRIASLWSVALATDVQPHQVALCMALLKAARLTHTPDHADSWADLAGYAALGSELATKDQP